MKNTQGKYLKIFLITLIFFSLLGCGGGSDDNPGPCTAQNSSELTSVNVFDGIPSSAYYGVTIANFKFSQATQIYPNNCNVNSYGATSLKITNTIAKTVGFSYVITAKIGLVTWQYQDVATIAPNTTIDVGVINSNVQKLSAGTVVIILNNITYQ